MKGEKTDLWEIQREYARRGIKVIAGVDEAGRGPLAGPVCAAAVILPFELEIPGLDDSKKLTEKKREELFEVITDKALSYGIAFADQREIDDINILNATFLAMNRALEKLDIPFQLALVDGNNVRGLNYNSESIVKGDTRCAAVAAASVLAKVTRDRYMLQMAEKYPQYAFEKHKGYPTKLHYERLREFGPSEIHRLTFLKKMH